MDSTGVQNRDYLKANPDGKEPQYSRKRPEWD
jgi:hypothetical protein